MCEIWGLTMSVCDFSAQSAMKSRIFRCGSCSEIAWMRTQKSVTEVTAPKSCTSANSVIPAYSIALCFYSGGVPEAERYA